MLVHLDAASSKMTLIAGNFIIAGGYGVGRATCFSPYHMLSPRAAECVVSEQGLAFRPPDDVVAVLMPMHQMISSTESRSATCGSRSSRLWV